MLLRQNKLKTRLRRLSPLNKFLSLRWTAMVFPVLLRWKFWVARANGKWRCMILGPNWIHQIQPWNRFLASDGQQNNTSGNHSDFFSSKQMALCLFSQLLSWHRQTFSPGLRWGLRSLPLKLVAFLIRFRSAIPKGSWMALLMRGLTAARELGKFSMYSEKLCCILSIQRVSNQGIKTNFVGCTTMPNGCALTAFLNYKGFHEVKHPVQKVEGK